MLLGFSTRRPCWASFTTGFAWNSYLKANKLRRHLHAWDTTNFFTLLKAKPETQVCPNANVRKLTIALNLKWEANEIGCFVPVSLLLGLFVWLCFCDNILRLHTITATSDNSSSYSTELPYCQILVFVSQNTLTSPPISVGLLRQTDEAAHQSMYKQLTMRLLTQP